MADQNENTLRLGSVGRWSHWLCCLLVALLLCSPANAQVGAVAELVAAQEALKGVNESIEKAKTGAKDTVNLVQADIATNLVKIQRLIDNIRKGVIKDTDVIVARTIEDVNQLLYTATSGGFALEAAVSQDVTNALLNAAKVLSGLHLSARPFVALAWPTTIMPGTRQDVRVHILGHFNSAWPKPEVTMDGRRLQSSLGVNELSFDLPRELMASKEGSRIHMTVTYPAENVWYWPTKYETRDLFVSVLPSAILSYKVLEAEAENPIQYVSAQKVYEFNTEAGKGDTNERTIPISRDTALGGFDFTNEFDLAQSRITAAVISNSGGNNPDGQNGSSITLDALGTQVVLTQKARGSSDHGCPFQCRWGEGANRYDRVVVTVALARKRSSGATQFTGGPAEGTVAWGKEVSLTPVGSANLTKVRMEITDHTYDPPVTRVLKLGEAYRESPFVSVRASAEGVTMAARSSRRN